MSSVQHLREFIRERLTAAAEEIFSEVEKTIVRYEEELHGLRRMMAISWKPELKLSRTAMELQRQSSDLQKPHVSMEEEASAIQQLCNQRRRSSHNQEEAEPQWSEEEQMEPDPPLTEEQEEPEPPLIEEQEEPEPPLIKDEDEGQELPQVKELEEPGWIKEENDKPESSMAKEEQKESEPPLIKEEKEEEVPEPQQVEEPEVLEYPLTEDVKEEPYFLWLKQEQQIPEHLPTRGDQMDLCNIQEGKNLVHKSIAVMETSTLQGCEGEPRTEQNSFYIPPVVETKDQEGSSSAGSESQSHTDTKRMPFRCDICGRSCKNKYRLERHYRTHTGERPFTCQTCGKGFAQIGDLNIHRRSHTGERPFSCQTCGKTFSRIDNLNVHKKIHTGEKPFSCQICGKGFIGRYHLNVHQRIHTGVRPFSCDICGKSFIEVRRLNMHMKQIHQSEK
ncbi:gastrula zinc finger protein XlCGF48.2 isoform X1 [Fundulus heteroclitus]|uniref:gastrula zinc finger protein XlCGF48.2 isoform X1 n=1 Tax=Fundulus heteroclitus TaxID=8078 RepID=UPI00165AECB0|nr:gastrula zinc finger protein XlCGF48.2 isoform X1 [Fundulus heteroclitus]